MDKYDKEINFHCAGIFFHIDLWILFLSLLDQYPEAKKENAKIGSLFDAPASTLWNGGRLLCGSRYNEEDLKFIKDFVNNHNIPIRFTFTNCLLEEKHLKDEYCNLLLNIFSTGENEITINSDLLKNYIEIEYPNKFKFISSVTKCLTKEETYDELKKDFHLVVLNYYFNHDFNFLQTIKEKNKIEILVNSKCGLNCKRRFAHYKVFSKCQLENNPQTSFYCPYKITNPDTRAHYITSKEINDIYIPLGFSNFKIEGRGDNPQMLLFELCEYLIKESYKDFIYDTVMLNLDKIKYEE